VTAVPRVLAIALAGLAGCLDALAPEVGPPSEVTTCDADSDPTREVSFATDVSPIFRRACDRCHQPGGDGQQQSGLDVSTYDSLRAGGTRSVGTIVIDRMPCSSVLYQKTGPAPPFGMRMPRNASPLADADRALIHDWIAEGAEDD
jgi:hypothetical protein